MSFLMAAVDVPTATQNDVTPAQSSLTSTHHQQQQKGESNKSHKETRNVICQLDGGVSPLRTVIPASHLKPKDKMLQTSKCSKSLGLVRATSRGGDEVVKSQALLEPLSSCPSSNCSEDSADHVACSKCCAAGETTEEPTKTCIFLPPGRRGDVLDCTCRQLTMLPCLHHPKEKLQHGGAAKEVARVRMLQLSHNNLTSLERPKSVQPTVQPLTLAAFTRVVLLDVSHNQIESLAGVELMSSLRVLRASRNRLVNLTPLFNATSALQRHGTLRVLDVSFNHIRSITDGDALEGGGAPLCQLRRLVLSYNYMTTLDDIEVLFPNVEELLVARNQVREAPRSLPKRICSFEIPQNYLDVAEQRYMEELIQNMRYLRKVNFSDQRMWPADAARNDAHIGDEADRSKSDAYNDEDLDPESGTNASDAADRIFSCCSDSEGCGDVQIDPMPAAKGPETTWNDNFKRKRSPSPKKAAAFANISPAAMTWPSSNIRNAVVDIGSMPQCMDEVVNAADFAYDFPPAASQRQGKFVDCHVNQVDKGSHHSSTRFYSSLHGSVCSFALQQEDFETLMGHGGKVEGGDIAQADAVSISFSRRVAKYQPCFNGANVREWLVVELRAPLQWRDVHKWHTAHSCCALRRTMQKRIDRRHRAPTIVTNDDTEKRDYSNVSEKKKTLSDRLTSFECLAPQ